MKTCPFCAEEIQDAAVVCKHCGRELAPAPTPAATKPKGNTLGVGCLGVVGVVIALAIIGALAGGSGTSTTQPNDRDAYLVCWQFVRQRLRAPATADFPTSSDPAVRVAAGAGPQQFVVRAYVDSQNGFGALVRTNFTCDVTWVRGEEYRLNDLKLDQ